MSGAPDVWSRVVREVQLTREENPLGFASRHLLACGHLLDDCDHDPAHYDAGELVPCRDCSRIAVWTRVAREEPPAEGKTAPRYLLECGHLLEADGERLEAGEDVACVECGRKTETPS